MSVHAFGSILSPVPTHHTLDKLRGSSRSACGPRRSWQRHRRILRLVVFIPGSELRVAEPAIEKHGLHDLALELVGTIVAGTKAHDVVDCAVRSRGGGGVGLIDTELDLRGVVTNRGHEPRAD